MKYTEQLDHFAWLFSNSSEQWLRLMSAVTAIGSVVDLFTWMFNAKTDANQWFDTSTMPLVGSFPEHAVAEYASKHFWNSVL